MFIWFLWFANRRFVLRLNKILSFFLKGCIGTAVSIRIKVILPYLLLTLLVAITGAYVATRLVTESLMEGLNNQLLEAGQFVSDGFAEREVESDRECASGGLYTWYVRSAP